MITKTLWFGNDGGLFRVDDINNINLGVTHYTDAGFTHIVGLGITQFYGVAASDGGGTLRVIGGDNTRMTNASGLDYYAFRDELLVASGTYNSATTQVLGFARTAQGNIAPSRDISGSNTGVSAASGWLAVVGVPLAQVFGDSFE